MDEWDDYDICYECTGYGYDYYIDDQGELVCACDDCPYYVTCKSCRVGTPRTSVTKEAAAERWNRRADNGK
jgi:hypothetical protein